MDKQSRTQSLTEQTLNVGSGAVASYLVWRFVIIPLIEAGILDVNQTAIITIIFTTLSLARGYVWRRVFNNYQATKNTRGR